MGPHLRVADDGSKEDKSWEVNDSQAFGFIVVVVVLLESEFLRGVKYRSTEGACFEGVLANGYLIVSFMQCG